MLVTKAIPNLYNGVSQQAPSVRMPSQATLQTNGFSSIVEGLKKRPPTEHVAKILEGSIGAVKLHIINRDPSEQYIVALTNGSIRVWDLQGTERTVHLPNGLGYLGTWNPQQDIQCVTVADHTFILNKAVAATMIGGSASTLPSVEYREISFSLPSVDYSYQYDLTVGAVNLTGVAGKNAGTLAAMVATFKDQLAQKFPTFTVTLVSSTIIRIASREVGVPAPGVSFVVREYTTRVIYTDVKYYDDQPYYTTTSERVYGANYSAYVTTQLYTAPAAASIKGAKQLFSDLPTSGNVSGDVWLVQGDPNNSFTGYYVKWNGGAWVETVEPGINNKPNGWTLPHLLVRNPDGTFTFKIAEWNERLVGTLTTAPNPSFIDRRISSVFFYRNRLGFLTDENVVFSKAGDFFNFFRGSATAVLDDDPIDISVSHTKVSILKHAIPFNRNLLLFSEQTQFILSTENNLTPKTVAIHQTTEFDCSGKVTPVASGPNCYFVTENGGWASVREYFVQEMAAINDADDITAHVPTYIPAGIRDLAASTNEDVVLVTTEGRPNSVFIYKYYWKGDEKLQSSWSEWTFGGKVLSVETVGTQVVLCIQYADGVYLESLNLQEGTTDSDMPVLVHLDRKFRQIGWYNAVTDQTVWTLPYPAENVQVVMDGAYGVNQGQILHTTMSSPRHVVANGNWSKVDVEGKGFAIIGVPYEFRYQFSPQYVKDRQNNPLAQAKMKMRNWSVFYDKSAHFKAEVKAIARDTGVYTFTGRKLGEAGLALGKIALSSGKFTFPVQTDATTVTIDIVNDSYLPCFLQSAEYEGFLVTRARPT